MKKVSLAIGLAICLLLTAFYVTPVWASQGITLSKTDFDMKEKGTATITGADIENGWVGIAAQGSGMEKTALGEYLCDLPADNVFEFKAPGEFGTYEIRVFNSMEYDELFATATFTVSPPKGGADDLILSKNEVKLKEPMSVQILGLSQGQIDQNAWVGYAKVGEELESTYFGEYIMDLAADNVYSFKAPKKFGKHEVRVFSNENYQAEDLYGTVEFTVVSSKAGPGDITLSKTAIQPNEQMSVTINGLTQGEIDENAWVGYAKVGEELEKTYLGEYIMDLPANNTWNFTAPNKAGVYEVRVFCSGSMPEEEFMEYAKFGTATFTVAGAVMENTGPSSWAVEEVNAAQGENLVTERIMVDFGKDLTREEFCELAIKLYERMTGQTAVPAAQNPFVDTSNPEILKAYQLGIVNGVAPNSFAPNSPVNRQEIATMLTRTLKGVMPDLNTDSAQFTESFSDANDIAPWAVQNLKFLNANTIFKGANGCILPTANTTREQGIALVKRIFDKFSEI